MKFNSANLFNFPDSGFPDYCLQLNDPIAVPPIERAKLLLAPVDHPSEAMVRNPLVGWAGNIKWVCKPLGRVSRCISRSCCCVHRLTFLFTFVVRYVYQVLP